MNDFLKLAQELGDYQHQHGKRFVIESPVGSQTWRHRHLREWIENFNRVAVDVCYFGPKDPYTEAPFKKRTMLVTNSDSLAELMDKAKCSCKTTDHKPVMGSTWQQDAAGKWTRISVAEFAGGYTAEFAKALLKGIEIRMPIRERTR